MSAAVRDRTDVYELGAGSGLVTTYEAACDACRWRGEAHEGGGVTWMECLENLAMDEFDRPESEGKK